MARADWDLIAHMHDVSLRLRTREEQEAFNNLTQKVYERLVDDNAIPVGRTLDMGSNWGFILGFSLIIGIYALLLYFGGVLAGFLGNCEVIL